jgi:sporulation protein YlmC with PRC-barrel domain
MKISGLVGREVLGSGGWRIGRVQEVVFDETNWQIRSLDVKLDRSVAQEFQMKKLFFKTTVKIDVTSVHAVGDHIMLSVTKSQLGKMAMIRK